MSPRSITMWPCPTITMPWLEIMWKNGFCFSLFLNWFLSMLRSLHVPNSSMVLGHVCDKDNKIWWMSRTMWLKITWPWPNNHHAMDPNHDACYAWYKLCSLWRNLNFWWPKTTKFPCCGLCVQHRQVPWPIIFLNKIKIKNVKDHICCWQRPKGHDHQLYDQGPIILAFV